MVLDNDDVLHNYSFVKEMNLPIMSHLAMEVIHHHMILLGISYKVHDAVMFSLPFYLTFMLFV